MIKGPKNAIPTVKGWVHPKTGELLKSQRITQKQIDEFFGVPEVTPAPQPEPEPVEVELTEIFVEEPEVESEPEEVAPTPRRRSVKNLFS